MRTVPARHGSPSSDKDLENLVIAILMDDDRMTGPAHHQRFTPEQRTCAPTRLAKFIDHFNDVPTTPVSLDLHG